MRPNRHMHNVAVALVFLVAGAASACSSTAGSPHEAGAGGAGGGGGAGQDAAPASDAKSFDVPSADSAASMTLTSSALAAGAAFAPENTCAGANTSPPLTWTAGPSGTMSYAVTLTDLDNGAVHWVIWDIPSGTTSLPANLPGDTTLTTPVMAKQLHKAQFFGAGGAYRGPCPMGATHTYQFEVNAIGSATLAGISGASTTEDIRTLAQDASLAHGDLRGTSNAAMPPADGGGQ